MSPLPRPLAPPQGQSSADSEQQKCLRKHHGHSALSDPLTGLRRAGGRGGGVPRGHGLGRCSASGPRRTEVPCRTAGWAGVGSSRKQAEEAWPLRASYPGPRDPCGLGLPATSGLCCACHAAGVPGSHHGTEWICLTLRPRAAGTGGAHAMGWEGRLAGWVSGPGLGQERTDAEPGTDSGPQEPVRH